MTTLYLIVFLCGIGLGLIIAAPLYFHFTKAGSLIIDQTDDIKDTYSFELEKPFYELPNCIYISLRVKVINTRKLINEDNKGTKVDKSN